MKKPQYGAWADQQAALERSVLGVCGHPHSKFTAAHGPQRERECAVGACETGFEKQGVHFGRIVNGFYTLDNHSNTDSATRFAISQVRFSHRRACRSSNGRTNGEWSGMRKNGGDIDTCSRNYAVRTRVRVLVDKLLFQIFDSSIDSGLLSHQHRHGFVDISNFIIQLTQLRFDVLDFIPEYLKTFASV